MEKDNKEIKTYINEGLIATLKHVQMNNIYAACKQLTPTDPEISFEKDFFTSVPKLYSSVNKLVLRHENKSWMLRNDDTINLEVAMDGVKLSSKEEKDNSFVPVCIIAVKSTD